MQRVEFIFENVILARVQILFNFMSFIFIFMSDFDFEPVLFFDNFCSTLI